MELNKVKTISELDQFLENSENEGLVIILYFILDSTLGAPESMELAELCTKLPIKVALISQKDAAEVVETQGVVRFPTFKLFVKGKEVQKLVKANLSEVEQAITTESLVDCLHKGLTVSVEQFGKTASGKLVHKITLHSGKGLQVVLLSYGAMIQSCKFPGRLGVPEELTLNYVRMTDIEQKGRQHYFGSTIGRVAGLTAHGLFTLHGEDYDLACNGPNGHHLNGGLQGFDKCVWDYEMKRSFSQGQVSVRFFRVSLNGEEGYPGTLDVQVTYTVSNENRLMINYEATTSAPTVLNLTNHTYWNLSGNLREKVNLHHLWINADEYLVVDSQMLPTGKRKKVFRTNFDYQIPVVLKWRIGKNKEKDLNHYFVINRQNAQNSTCCNLSRRPSQQQGPIKAWKRFLSNNQNGRIIQNVKKKDLVHMASLSHSESGRHMKIYGTQPALQVYTCNDLPDAREYFPFVRHNAICLKAQHFPHSPNCLEFNPGIFLNAGEVYWDCVYYEFSLEESDESPNTSCQVCAIS